MSAKMEATLQLAHGGRLIIPVKMRQALHLEEGSRVVARLKQGTLLLVPVDEALDALQTEASALLKGAPSLSAALIAERKAEARHG